MFPLHDVVLDAAIIFSKEVDVSSSSIVLIVPLDALFNDGVVVVDSISKLCS